MCVPSDIGRIHYKIEHAFHSFTADQYKTWVVHYSIIIMLSRYIWNVSDILI